MYKEDDFLQLSGIQHFAFCRRQWALAYIELQWQENVRTVEGHLLHENAHDAAIKEKRGDLIVVRAMPVHSKELGISGECDVVEFHKAEDGIPISGREGKYTVIPVEYKRENPNPMTLMRCRSRRRHCVWKKCYAATSLMDMFIMERSDAVRR